MALQQLENPYFTREELERTPSRAAGVDAATEERLRIFGCELIQSAGILLKLSQVAMATAQVLLHRFYAKQSLVSYNVKVAARACIMIASKMEENMKYPADVLNVFYLLDQFNMGRTMDECKVLRRNSIDYIQLKDELLAAERKILKEFGFDLFVEHPHKYLIQFLSIIGLDTNAELAQKAWNCLNDSQRLPICLRFRPEIIACACIYMAARMCGIVMPESPTPWWEVFDCNKDDLDEIASLIQSLYESPKAKYISLSRLIAQQEEEKKEKEASRRSRDRSRDRRDDRGDSRRRERSRDRSRDRSRKRSRDRGSYDDRRRDRSRDRR